MQSSPLDETEDKTGKILLTSSTKHTCTQYLQHGTASQDSLSGPCLIIILIIKLYMLLYLVLSLTIQPLVQQSSFYIQKVFNSTVTKACYGPISSYNFKLFFSTLKLNKCYTRFASYGLQCNELNRGHPTLISQSQVTFTTKESGFSSL